MNTETQYKLFIKERTKEEITEIYELANWLQFKGVEKRKEYWRWHIKIQQLIRLIEMNYGEHYYKEYFYPYIVEKDNWLSKDPKDHYTIENWEKDFPRDYYSLLEKYKEELNLI